MRTFLYSMLTLLVIGQVTRADETSHQKVADELLDAMQFDKTMRDSVNSMLDVQIRSNPQLKPFETVMKKFLEKHMLSGDVKKEISKLYVKEFSESELRELIEFYQTPVGKKSIEKMPVLMRQGAEIGAKKVQENQAELIQMIQDAEKNSP